MPGESDSRGPGSVGLVQTEFARIELPPEGFRMECGEALPELTIAYETYGRLSQGKDNVVFICHALSGDAHVAGYHDPSDAKNGWWDEMVGPGKGIDTDYYYVICANILGGCKGTTGPSSINPKTGRPYGSSFPGIGVADIVNAHRELVKHLGIERLAAVVGGSFGGMQVLEWVIRYPEMVDRGICIASATSLSAQAISFDVVGCSAIMSDPNWQGGDYYGTGHSPDKGLSIARKIAHITYLSPEMMTKKFGRERDAENNVFQVERYLKHQGKKFVDRFDANSYVRIAGAMDEYDVARSYGSVSRAFDLVRSRMLIIALSSDWLFPPEQSMEIANALLRAGREVSYCKLHAPYGHDAFLVDIENLSEVIKAFLPWVSMEGTASRRMQRAIARDYTGITMKKEHEHIIRMCRPGARVLDLGCGNGKLLSMLEEKRGASGIGVDISIDHVIEVLDKGYNIFQEDIDAGLAMIPDETYDCAILSETLQVVHRPRFVLHEMLRVAREVIVSFPNFGNIIHRLHLFFIGRMPKAKSLPYEWYNTPNIHLTTLVDFVGLCKNDRIKILEVVPIADGGLRRLLVKAGLPNLGADHLIVRITRAPGYKRPE